MDRHPWAQMFKEWTQSQAETQCELAERLGVTQSVVSAWCNGKRIPTDGWQRTIADLTSGQVPTMIDGYRRGVGLCGD